MSETNSHERSNAIDAKALDAEALDEEEQVNPVLARLIEEVRNEGTKGQTSYDRVHNRHNR